MFDYELQGKGEGPGSSGLVTWIKGHGIINLGQPRAVKKNTIYVITARAITPVAFVIT